MASKYIDEKNVFNILSPKFIEDLKAVGEYDNVQKLFDESRYIMLNIVNYDFGYKSVAHKQLIASQLMFFGNYMDLVYTDNITNLIHIGKHRLCNRAQTEVRDLITNLYKSFKENDEVIYNILIELGLPECINGKCPEGKLCCGQSELVKEKFI